MTVNKNIDDEDYKQTLASILPTKFVPGSLADRLLIQGREEGREEGREVGREEGERIGELIGKIQLLEELLGLPGTDKSDLLALNLETLRARVASLQVEQGQRSHRGAGEPQAGNCKIDKFGMSSYLIRNKPHNLRQSCTGRSVC
ncbi:MAG: hypothetical protein JNM43_22650 [Planctomycetaceae bacterium]|nr:hypothetical protein [Planctomycetaceae bacterium]